MKEWCKKYYIHAILVGLVAVVGGVAAFLYIDQFGANGFSKKTGDWANFATYISGTLGVAAVVATLMAFVITLRQQQDLVESQRVMLAKQEYQIELIEQQLDEEQERREIELAYNRSLNIFPTLIDALRVDLKKEIYVYEGEDDFHDEISDVLRKMCFNISDLVDQKIDLREILLKYDKDLVFDFVERVFSNTEVIYVFVCENIGFSEDLKVFFDSYLNQEWRYGEKLYAYLYFYHAYLLGCGQHKYAKFGIDFLDFPDSEAFLQGKVREWFDIGMYVQDVLEVESIVE